MPFSAQMEFEVIDSVSISTDKDGRNATVNLLIPKITLVVDNVFQGEGMRHTVVLENATLSGKGNVFMEMLQNVSD